jgi:hypothetical protein
MDGGVQRAWDRQTKKVQTLGQREKELAAVRARVTRRDGSSALLDRGFAIIEGALCSAQRKLDESRAENETLVRQV